MWSAPRLVISGTLSVATMRVAPGTPISRAPVGSVKARPPMGAGREEGREPRAGGAFDRALQRLGLVEVDGRAHAEVKGVDAEPGDRHGIRRCGRGDGLTRGPCAGRGGGSEKMAAVDGHGAPRRDSRRDHFKNRAVRPVSRWDSETRLTAARGEQRQQDRLAGAQDVAALPAQRNVDELRERSGTGRLERVPIGVVAEIIARIVRNPGHSARRACGRKQADERRMAAPRGRRIRRNRAVRAKLPVDVGKQHRDRVARARLDAHERRARRKPQHQHDIGPVPRQQQRQVAVDRGVARLEHVRDAAQTQKSRPSRFRQCERERAARVDRRAGEGAKPGDEGGCHPGATGCARCSRVLLDCGLTKTETTSGWSLQMRVSIAATACSISGVVSGSLNSRLSAATTWSGARWTVTRSLTRSTPGCSAAILRIERVVLPRAPSPISSSLLSRARNVAVTASRRPIPIEATPSSTGIASRSAAKVPMNAMTMPISAAESSNSTRKEGGSLLRVTASKYPSEPRSLLNSLSAIMNVAPSNTNETPSTM